MKLSTIDENIIAVRENCIHSLIAPNFIAIPDEKEITKILESLMEDLMKKEVQKTSSTLEVYRKMWKIIETIDVLKEYRNRANAKVKLIIENKNINIKFQCFKKIAEEVKIKVLKKFFSEIKVKYSPEYCVLF